MAAQSRARTTSGSRRAQSASDQATLPFGALRRAGGWVARLRSFRPNVGLGGRLRREVVGVLLVLVALVSAWALGRGRQDGPVLAWWGGLLEGVFGWAALLVPAYLALTAIRAFRVTGEPILLARHLLGGFAYLVAAAGLMQMAEPRDDPAIAGYVGRGIGTLADRSLGVFASGLVLAAAGFLAVFLLADLDLRTFEAEIRALWPRRVEPEDDPAAGPEPVPDLLAA